MSEPVQEAGGVVVRYDGGAPLFLVVRSSDGKNWLFPKGHIELSETAELAALREVREEAGVEATLRVPLGRIQFSRSGSTISVIFYLLEFVSFTKPQDDRATRWCTYPEVRDFLPYQETKEIADKAFAAVAGQPRV